MNRLLASVPAFGLLSSLVACGTNPDANILKSRRGRLTSPSAPAEDVLAVSAGNNALGVDLLRRQPTDQNTFFSPYSLSVALAMAYQGANGDTQQQMSTSLHFPFPPERLAPAVDKLDLAIASHAQDAAAVQIANAAWVQSGFKILDSYLDALAEFYGAGVGVTDFRNPRKAAAEINAWASDHTAGRVRQLVDPDKLDDEVKLVLANAIYFKALWRSQFDPASTAQAPFHRLDGTQVSATTMSVDANFAYARGRGFEAVELPYLNGAHSMVIVLPDSGTFSDFIAGLDWPKLDSIFSCLSTTRIQLFMPKFTVDKRLKDLETTLQEMGMTDAFSPSRADFSGIDGRRDLSIFFVVHQAYVNVNESGTEAAAATAVGIGTVSTVPRVAIDRPFLFFIRDLETGAVLFVGQVVSPIAT